MSGHTEKENPVDRHAWELELADELEMPFQDGILEYVDQASMAIRGLVSDAKRMEAEIADHEKAYGLLFKETARLRDLIDGIGSALASEIECEVFEAHVQPALERIARAQGIQS